MSAKPWAWQGALDDADALSLAGDVARLANAERERAVSALLCYRLGYGWFLSKCNVECLVFTAAGEPQSVADHGVNELGLVLLRLAERGFLDHRFGNGFAPQDDFAALKPASAGQR